MERQSNGQNQARVELQALQSNADSTKVQYEAFVGRLRATDGQDMAAPPESRIISSAAYPLTPSEPRRGLIVGASIPFGLLLGVLAALLVEYTGTAAPLFVKKGAAPPSIGVEAKLYAIARQPDRRPKRGRCPRPCLCLGWPADPGGTGQC